MGIKNLPLQLNEAGKIKIGIKGKEATSENGKSFRMPQKLDHFRLVTTERDENGDFIIDANLQDKIITAGTGILNAEGNLVGIPIRLLYDGIDENFPSQYACYASGKLICSGNGEISTRRIDDFKKEHPCPCPRIAQGYEGKDKCKPMGKLTCIIDEAGLFGQAHTFRTTSMNSVVGITGGLKLLLASTKGRLAGLPLMLTLNAKHTSTPTGVQTLVYVVSVCYRGNMSALRQEVLMMIAQENQYQIGMDIPINPDHATVGIQPGSEEEQEFVEEFFPDAVVITESTKAAIKTATKEDVSNGTKQEQEQKTEQSEGCEESGQGNQVSDGSTGQDEDENDTATNDGNGTGGKCILKGRLLTEQGDNSSYAVLYNRFMVLLQDDKREEAAKMANRLTVKYLKTWFRKEQPGVVLPEGIKKPELLIELQKILDSVGQVLSHEAPVQIEPDPPIDMEDTGDTGDTIETVKAETGKADETEERHPFLVTLEAMESQKDVADAVSGFFHPVPINKTLGIPALIDLVAKEILLWATKKKDQPQPAQPGQGGVVFEHTEPPVPEPGHDQEPTEKPVTETLPLSRVAAPIDAPAIKKYPREFDAESGPVRKDQLRYLVQLKANLERQKLLVSTPQAWLVCVSYFLGEDNKPIDTAKNLTSAQCDTFIEMLELQLEKQEELIPF